MRYVQSNGSPASTPDSMIRGLARGRRSAVLVVLPVLVALAFVLPRAASGEVASETFAVSGASNDQLSPDVDGNVIVWEDGRNGNSDVFGKDLSTVQEFRITENLADQLRPRVSGNVVVWEDNRGGDWDIWGYDLATKREFRITTDVADQRRPDVDGGTVVWEDHRNGGWAIFGYDLATRTEREVSTGPGDKRRAALSGDIVVWEDSREGLGHSDIYAKDLSTGREFPVSTDAAFKDTPAVSGAIVVWRQESPGNYDIFGKNVYAKDLETGKVFQITTSAADQWAPAISGDVVVWADGRGGTSDVYGKDLSTGEEFRVSSDAAPQETPAIDGETVVWEAQNTGAPNYGAWDVEGSTLDTAPAAPAGLRAEGLDGGVRLAWAPSGEADLAGYDVYRSGSSEGGYVKLNASPLTAPSYFDADATPGSASYYRVHAVDAAGNESASSESSAAALATSSLEFAADRPSLSFGEVAALSGRLTYEVPGGARPAPAQQVVLEERPTGAARFAEAARTSTGGDGRFDFTGVKPEKTTDYRARFAGDPGAGLKPAFSVTKRVTLNRLPSTLTLAAGPSTLSYGKASTLSGRLSSNGKALPGKRVVLQQKLIGASKFAPMRQVTTGATGAYSFAGVVPRKHTDYRVVFAGETGLGPSVSPSRRVEVRAVVSMRTSATSVKARRSLTISGSVAPTHRGSVTLTIEGGGKIVTKRGASSSRVRISRTLALSNSRYSFRYRPTKPGIYTVRVSFGGDRDHLGSVGPARRFKVVR